MTSPLAIAASGVSIALASRSSVHARWTEIVGRLWFVWLFTASRLSADAPHPSAARRS